MTTITQALVPDLDEALYHSGAWLDEPSLSVSGAKRILKSPALYKWEQENPPTRKVYDFGHAAHAKVLGVGLEVVTCPPDLLGSNGAASTTKAKEWIAAAKADGKVVLTAKELATVDGMATALEDHKEATELLSEGWAEQSLVWRDDETKILLRGRVDWLTEWHGIPLVVDYKTCDDPDPESFRWDAGKYGYVQQDPWYREGMEVITGKSHGFLFIAQSKVAPYLVSVVELDDEAREIGAQRNAVARRTFLECMTTGHWPAYPGITRISVPNARLAKEYTNV